ncbi:MAG: 23S rRNA (uracil-5-)-methyltransferase RumA [candidate division Zixibacteria bacterium RBG_16_48_11]|nr:MAG: 23S rRNA (uracil-5-)-methyltransferase RumA [candidate division Zixibacteria bacterium RBG_16_48_11]
MSFPVPTFKKGELLDLAVESVAFGGQGVARHNGLVIFVQNALPGDQVRARVLKLKPNFIEAETVELTRASVFRTIPRCSHFGICGGCKWQNLDYAKQVEYKTQQVKETLEHLGGFAQPPVLPAFPAEEIYFYRNKMEFSFSTDEQGGLTLGLHRAGRFDQVFDLEACYLQSETSNQIIHRIKEFCRREKLSVYDLNQHSGFLRFLVIKQAQNTGQILVNLVTTQGDGSRLVILAQQLREEFPAVKSVVRNINSKRAQIAIGEREELLAGQPYITEKIGPFQFRISANSFFQSNSRQAEKLYSLVVEYAQTQPKDEILDLYSGTGTISFFLAQSAGKVLGIESSYSTVEDARQNAQLNGITNCQFICSQAKDYLALARVRKEKFDAVVVDPPRSGLHPEVVKNLVELASPRMVYVSCNPATLARDLKLLCEKVYQLEKVQPVDMFPHTFHIESVSLLTKKS